MFFVFTFVHRKLDLWQQYRDDHLAWLHRQADAGAVRASGPFTDVIGTGVLAAMIVVRADDETAARAVIASDPFMRHGVTEDLVVRPWNPFIGAFAAETSPPKELDE